MANVDATRAIDELEAVLAGGAEAGRCGEVLEILRRWQWDRDLDEHSRRRAHEVVRRFCRAGT